MWDGNRYSLSLLLLLVMFHRSDFSPLSLCEGAGSSGGQGGELCGQQEVDWILRGFLLSGSPPGGLSSQIFSFALHTCAYVCEGLRPLVMSSILPVKSCIR